MLLLSALTVLRAEFTCVLWVFILYEYKFLNPQAAFQVRSCNTAVCCDSQSDSICLSPGDFSIGKSPLHHKRASSMLYGWCDKEACSSFHNSSPHISPPIWAKDFELWFVSLNDFVPLLYYPVFVHLGSLKPFDTVFLYQ